MISKEFLKDLPWGIGDQNIDPVALRLFQMGNGEFDSWSREARESCETLLTALNLVGEIPDLADYGVGGEHGNMATKVGHGVLGNRTVFRDLVSTLENGLQLIEHTKKLRGQYRQQKF